MKRVVGFGDFLLRLSPPGYRRFSQAQSFETCYTGAEANVCASLAVMGQQAVFVSRVPDNPIAEAGLAELRRLNVDVSQVVRGGDRLGIYYLEKGASQRPSNVVYDRKGSGFAAARRADFDWRRILAGAGWFHFSGVTPAVGDELPAIVEEACRTAEKLGVRISCDLNYRSRMWTVRKARKTMPQLVRHADCLIANVWDAKNLLGVDVDEDDELAVSCARILRAYPKLKCLAMTTRGQPSASDNTLEGLLYMKGRLYRSRRYAMHLVDRIGGGDAFAPGLIYSLGQRLSPQKAVEFATAAGCLKHSIELDINLSTADEVRRLADSSGCGGVLR